MITILFVSLFSLIITGMGWLLVDLLDRTQALKTLERLGVSFTIGFLFVYFGVFITGPFLLNSTSIWTLLAICSLVSIPGLKRMPWRSFWATLQSEVREARQDKWLGLLWLAILSIATSSLVQALAPPNDFDSLVYHLAAPRLDVEAGKLVLAVKMQTVFGSYFPALGGHITRVMLTVMNEGAAQMIHGVFGVLGAMTAASLVFHYGYGKTTALIAALLFLSIRMVVWAMGTAETDIPIAALATLALALCLIARSEKSIGLEILFGLVLGAAILFKYIGFVTAISLAPILIYDLIQRRKPLNLFFIAPVVALVTITPHLVRNYLLIGNPVYPLFIKNLNPGLPDMLADTAGNLGTGRSLLDFLTVPWNMSILPTHYFDGMVMGAPYLLALCPLILVEKGALRKWAGPLSFVLVYTIVWFWFLSQQVRFFAPAMPVLSAVAAAGIVGYWQNIRQIRIIKTAFVLLVLGLAITQSMFIGIFSIIRLPVSLGIISAADYHDKTPTMRGASYAVCTYINDNLKPGETYFALTDYLTSYCPQQPVAFEFFKEEEGWWMTSHTPPEMTQADFLMRLNREKFRYYLVKWKKETRGQVDSRAVVLEMDLSQKRFGAYLEPAFKKLKPLTSDDYTAVYDGLAVLKLLNQQAKNNAD